MACRLLRCDQKSKFRRKLFSARNSAGIRILLGGNHGENYKQGRFDSCERRARRRGAAQNWRTDPASFEERREAARGNEDEGQRKTEKRAEDTKRWQRSRARQTEWRRRQRIEFHGASNRPNIGRSSGRRIAASGRARLVGIWQSKAKLIRR